MPSLLDLFKSGPLQEYALHFDMIEGRERVRVERVLSSSRRTRKPPAGKATVAPRTMRVKAAAKYLGISEWTLRRHVHNGEIPYLPGKIWRFVIADLERFLDQCKETREVL